MMPRAWNRPDADPEAACGSTKSVRRLVVCADDFGLDRPVNAGALTLAGLQRLSAIGCMVGAPFWRSDAPALRSLDTANVDIGLHLDLTQHPLDGRIRRSLPEWILRSHCGALDRPGLRREIDAQLDAFADEMQRPPAFVDGHEHVHQLPGVRDVLVEALAARDQRPWLRSTRRPPALGSPKARLIEAFGATGLARRAQAHGLQQNGRLLGIYDFSGRRGAYLKCMRQWLAVAEDGDLLVCHPAASWSVAAPHAAARFREYNVLVGAAFGAMLADAGLRIAPLRCAIG